MALHRNKQLEIKLDNSCRQLQLPVKSWRRANLDDQSIGSAREEEKGGEEGRSATVSADCVPEGKGDAVKASAKRRITGRAACVAE